MSIREKHTDKMEEILEKDMYADEGFSEIDEEDQRPETQKVMKQERRQQRKNRRKNWKLRNKIAIVGPTGAGKTTLVNLLMKFYDIKDGDILIDGVSVKDLTRENIHDLFIMVLQDTWLFEGTVKENIVYNQENIPFERVKEVCKLVGLDHVIKSLNKGYDTVLNEDTSLSAGQKQLFTIARAMLEDSPLMILDEATSSVDTRTELHVQQARHPKHAQCQAWETVLPLPGEPWKEAWQREPPRQENSHVKPPPYDQHHPFALDQEIASPLCPSHSKNSPHQSIPPGHVQLPTAVDYVAQ